MKISFQKMKSEDRITHGIFIIYFRICNPIVQISLPKVLVF